MQPMTDSELAAIRADLAERTDTRAARLLAEVERLQLAAKCPTIHQRQVMRFGKQMAAATMREAAVEVLRNGTNTLLPPLRNPQGFAVLEWAVAAIRALPLPGERITMPLTHSPDCHIEEMSMPTVGFDPAAPGGDREARTVVGALALLPGYTGWASLGADGVVRPCEAKEADVFVRGRLDADQPQIVEANG